jgi:gluconolactonase
MERYTAKLLASLLLLAGSMAKVDELRAQGPQAQAPGAVFEPQYPATNNAYPLTKDSMPQPGVAKGTALRFDLTDSHIYPGVTRTISVYVPAAYKPEKAACVFVFLDGIGFGAETVFDNLIAAHQMPVTIAVGISPGTVVADGDAGSKRYDRSFEFDNRTDRLARFLLEEVLPAVEKQTTKDGRAIHLSHDGNDRAIGGGSTGGIAAFNAAWQRPDEFRRVYTTIGTFVGMRGGEQIYVQVRKTEPKPIRVFMTDGANDGWGGGLEMGDWFMSNLTMERALAYAGYDVNHVWGAGSHNGNQAAQVFPDAVRWLFRDYPAAIKAMPPNNQQLKPVLIDGEGWKVAFANCGAAPLAVNAQGVVLAGKTAGVERLAASGCGPEAVAGTIAVAADGAVYSVREGEQGIAVTAAAGARKILAKDLHVTAMALRADGTAYVASGAAGAGDAPSQLWLMHADGTRARVGETPKEVAALAVSPDGGWLMAGQPGSHLSYSFRIRKDGMLDDGEPFYDLYPAAIGDGSGVREIAMDREGRAYAATSLGVQICDHNGRVMGILPLPGNQAADAVSFGGDDFKTLYVHSGTTIYARKLRIGGVFPAASRIKIPDWGGG